MALKLWLSITTPDCFAAEDKCYVVSENMIILLYNIIDLLSLKVCSLILLLAAVFGEENLHCRCLTLSQLIDEKTLLFVL